MTRRILTIVLWLITLGTVAVASAETLDELAVTRLIKQCQKGEASACRVLAYRYDKGTGVTQDYAKAVELYRKACDGQEAGGCFNLGVTYATGIGVRQSDDEARKFLGKACDLKSESGCTQYARLKTEKK